MAEARHGSSGRVPRDEEVDREAADDPVRGEDGPDPHSGLVDLHPVVVVGREEAAEVDLTARTAEELVVRRDRDDRAVRVDPQLDARRLLLRPLDPLLHDAAHAAEAVPM